jgi:hypothetical protein
LRRDGRADVVVVAGGAAVDVLSASGEDPEPFRLADGSAHVAPGQDPAPLLDAGRALLARVRPDAIVVGISSLGVGLDEALLACADRRPTFALQDYPGDANAIDGRYADVYFVRDAAAAALTAQRFGVSTIAIGSLRHVAYERLDVPALRRRTRARLGHTDGPVIGFFGQPPDIPGHEAGFGHLVAALAGRRPRPLVVLREHPKAMQGRRSHLAALVAAGLATFDASGADAVEPWLAACDLVVTCFSHCTMDFAFLEAWSPEPLGAVLLLMTTPEIRAFMSDYAGLDVPDGVEQGLGQLATHPDDVAPLLDALLATRGRAEFRAAAARLPRRADVDTVVARVVDAATQRLALK